MNKYILPYSEKLNESIGRGSVILIKGRPTKEGRFLYVTTINGYAEIKPGIKMVFIGDTIYRVIHKGGNKFAGRKIDYKGEDGLKGVFNMKTPGRPSVVLNHNKTPFHWITLKHLDIGSALREIGTRLFNHELILESKDSTSSDESAKSYLLGEVLKLITGRPTVLKLVDVDVHEGGDNLTNVEHNEGIIDDYITDIAMTLTSNQDKIPDAYIDYLDGIGLFPTDLGLGVISDEDRKLLGLSNDKDGALFNIVYSTNATINETYDPGDYWTPPAGDIEVDDVSTILLEDDSFYVDGDQVKITPDLQLEVDIYNEMIEDKEPDELVSDIEEISSGKASTKVSFKRDSSLTARLRELYYNYMKSVVQLRKNGMSDEDKKKWSKLDTLDPNKIEDQVEDIIKRQKELEEIEDNEKEELTQDQIAESNTLIDSLYKLVPEDRSQFRHNKGINSKRKIDRIYEIGIRGGLMSLTHNISNPEESKKRLERALLDLNYEKAKKQLLGKQSGSKLDKMQKKLDFYLNQ